MFWTKNLYKNLVNMINMIKFKHIWAQLAIIAFFALSKSKQIYVSDTNQSQIHREGNNGRDILWAQPNHIQWASFITRTFVLKVVEVIINRNLELIEHLFLTAVHI
jgi:hypothetical protein